MREVVKHNKVVLVARNARNRRSPQITVDKVKDSGRMGRRVRKRKTNMTTQLARMTQMLIVSPSAGYVGTPTELCQGIPARMAKAAVPSSGGRSGGESS